MKSSNNVILQFDQNRFGFSQIFARYKSLLLLRREVKGVVSLETVPIYLIASEPYRYAAIQRYKMSY